MKHFQKFLALALPMLLSLVLFSCADDIVVDRSGNAQNQKQNLLVGEWLEDLSTEDEVVMGTSTFTQDGKYYSWAFISYQELNVKGEGTYTYSDNTIKLRYKNELLGNKPIEETWKVQKLDAYTLVEYESENYTIVSTMYRIVDTYNMTVGQSKNFVFADANFVPSSYKSCDEKVATVSATGEIQAVKRGTTFIRVTAPVGEVAVRIVVTDGNHAVDDYVQYAGGPVQAVKDYFGKPVYEGVMSANGSHALAYFLNDDMISSLVFYYNRNNYIHTIVATFLSDVDIAPVIAEYDKKYEKRVGSKEGYHHYKTKVDDETLDIVIDEEYRNLYFKFQNPFEAIDGLYRLNAEDLAVALNHEFNNEEDNGQFISGAGGIFEDNEIFYGAAVLYDPASLGVKMVNLYVRSGFTQEEIEEWYKKNYIYNDRTGYYLTSETLLTSECGIKIATNAQNGRVTVAYMNLMNIN